MVSSRRSERCAAPRFGARCPKRGRPVSRRAVRGRKQAVRVSETGRPGVRNGPSGVERAPATPQIVGTHWRVDGSDASCAVSGRLAQRWRALPARCAWTCGCQALASLLRSVVHRDATCALSGRFVEILGSRRFARELRVEWSARWAARVCRRFGGELRVGWSAREMWRDFFGVSSLRARVARSVVGSRSGSASSSPSVLSVQW